MTLTSETRAPEGRERAATIRAKDRKWLQKICDWTSRPVGMYPGIACKLIPYGPAERLRRLGMVDTYEPHNPVHDTRYVATEAGLHALSFSPTLESQNEGEPSRKVLSGQSVSLSTSEGRSANAAATKREPLSPAPVNTHAKEA